MAQKKPRIPLHTQIARQLRREIARSKRPGDRLDSELAIAKRYATSVLTVREALSALSEQGVVDRRHGSGTYVLDPLARQHVAVYTDLDISHPRTSYFQLRVIQQLRQMVRAFGYRARLYVGETQPGQPWDGVPTCPEFLESLAAGDICAVAAVATGPGSWKAMCDAESIPVVGGATGFEYRVPTDGEAIVPQGVERLILRGRTRICYLGWSGEGRFKKCIADHGLPVHDEWVRGDLHPSTEGAGWEEFRSIWLSRSEKPDGLLIGDDLLLPDAAAAILDMGISVPEQLMIVSQMNRGSMALLPFPVDQMEFDPDLVAAAMGDRLIRAMRHETVAQPELIVGFQWRYAGDQAQSRPRAVSAKHD